MLVLKFSVKKGGFGFYISRAMLKKLFSLKSILVRNLSLNTNSLAYILLYLIIFNIVTLSKKLKPFVYSYLDTFCDIFLLKLLKSLSQFLTKFAQ
uniref:Uncharacterized protein n=1 Tax=Heterorhabditis bacteriophora TaxID=37862 RepID=A0A1I7WFI0_HETBA